MRIAICIGTYRRPELLSRLLGALSRLKSCSVRAPAVEVIVVDNDPMSSESDPCKNISLPYPLRYVVEPSRGIVQVRNRAVALADGADFVAFLDDDEVPCETWLDELLKTQAAFDADVVAGPTRPAYGPGVASWVRRGGFFQRPEYKTGKPMKFCAAGNVLVRRAIFDRVGGFDERFQLTGAEDTQFFLRVRRAGYTIVWSNEAVVHEIVPKERARLGWILRRGYQSGSGWSRSELSLGAGLKVCLLRLVKGALHIIVGSASAFIGVFFGRAVVAKGLRRVCLGAGMLAGLTGRKFLAYQSANNTGVSGQPEYSGRRSS